MGASSAGWWESKVRSTRLGSAPGDGGRVGVRVSLARWLGGCAAPLEWVADLPYPFEMLSRTSKVWGGRGGISVRFRSSRFLQGKGRCGVTRSRRGRIWCNWWGGGRGRTCGGRRLG